MHWEAGLFWDVFSVSGPSFHLSHSFSTSPVLPLLRFPPCFSWNSSFFYSIQKCKILELIVVKYFYRMHQHMNLCSAEFFLIASFPPSGSFLGLHSAINTVVTSSLRLSAHPLSTKSWEEAVDSGEQCQESGARLSLSPFLSGDARK